MSRFRRNPDDRVKTLAQQALAQLQGGKVERALAPFREPEPSGPPRDFTWMPLHGEVDENYEIAMSEDGVMAYKIVGEVWAGQDRDIDRMWSKAKSEGRSRLTHADVLRFFTLPEGFWPEATVVGVGWNGKSYHVYILDVEDISARTVAAGIRSPADALYLAQHVLRDAQKPRMAARVIDRRAQDIQFGHLKKNPIGRRRRSRRNRR